MKRKKCLTADKKKKKIGIITSLVAILCIGMAFGYIRFVDGYRTFRAPEHEESAVKGTPEASGSYQTLPVREGYAVGIDTVPAFKDGLLYLNAANVEDNTIWFLVRVYKGDDKIAQTGILHQGEYVESVECDQKLSEGENVEIQIVAYEPETYHSEGVARITCQVAGK